MIIDDAKMLHRGSLVRASILIQDGIISRIAKIIRADLPKVNARGDLVIPGAIDVHVHFRDLDQSHKEDWFTGSLAAAAGGVTCVIDQPNTIPPTQDASSFRLKLSKAKSNSVVDFCLNFWLNHPRDLGELLSLGAAGMGEIMMHELDRDHLERILNWVRDLDLVVSFHPEDRELSESNAILELIDLGSKYGLRKLHLAHLSLASSLRMALSHAISFEVNLAHLMLWDKWAYPIRPPLRSRYHPRFLWENLESIPIISSDHAPHLESEIAQGSRGIPGVQEMLPLLFHQLSKGRIGIGDIITKLCLNPAKLYGIPGKGRLAPGYHGDVVVIDLSRERRFSQEDILSKSGWSAYLGRKMIFPRITIIRGHVVYQDGELQVPRGYGKFIPIPHRIPGSIQDNPLGPSWLEP